MYWYKRYKAGENDYHSCQLVTSHNGPNPLPKTCTDSKKFIGANC